MKKFVRAQTQVRLKKLQAEFRRATRSPEDPEAVHDLRVAIRRFVQCLRAFKQFFDEEQAKKIRKSLKKLMKRSGEVRNRDITIDLLKEAGLDGAPAVAALERQRLDAEKEFVRTLHRWPKRRAEEWSSRLKPSPHGDGPWDASQDAPANARAVLPAMTGDLFEAGGEAAAPEAGHDAMHQFRLRAKRLRYTLEIFEPVYRAGGSEDLKRALGQMKDLQDRLGAINDCVTARALLEHDRAAIAAVEGLLPGREAEFRRYWKQRFGPAARKRWTAWLSKPEAN